MDFRQRQVGRWIESLRTSSSSQACLFVCWLVCFVIAISEFLECYNNAAKAVPLLQRVPAEPPTRKWTQVQHEAQAEVDATAV